MKNRIHFIGLVGGCWFALVHLIGCDTEREFYVDHHLNTCWGEEKFLCMMVDEGDGFETFYSGIKGFTFEWGYTYHLRIIEDDVLFPPEGGSSVEYSLDEIIEKTPVAAETTFDIEFEPNDPTIELADATGGTLMDGTEFTCDTQTICEQLATALEARQAFFYVSFGYTKSEKRGVLPLVVLDVR